MTKFYHAEALQNDLEALVRPERPHKPAMKAVRNKKSAEGKAQIEAIKKFEADKAEYDRAVKQYAAERRVMIVKWQKDLAAQYGLSVLQFQTIYSWIYSKLKLNNDWKAMEHEFGEMVETIRKFNGVKEPLPEPEEVAA